MGRDTDLLEVIVSSSYKPVYRKRVSIRDRRKIRGIVEDLRDKFGIDLKF